MDNKNLEISAESVDSLNAFERITEGAKSLMSRLSSNESTQPGHLYPSKATNENIYDCSNSRSGVAIIFNQINIADQLVINGSEIDTTDLGELLSDIGFDVKICINFTVKKVREELYGCKLTLIQNHIKLFHKNVF